MEQEKKDSIAIVFSGLYVGGAEKLGVSLANKFVSGGNPTYIIAFKEVDCTYLHLIDKRIEIIYIPRKSKFDVILNRPFYKAISDRGINKVIFFCLSPLFLSRIFSFKRNKAVSYFITVHSTIPVNIKEYFKTMLFLRFIRKTDKVLFVCQNQRLYYQRKYSFSPPLCDVIHNGVDVDYFKPGNLTQAANKKDALQIAASDKVILLVATLRPEKGHAYAIEALNILHSNYPGKNNTNLVFTGAGNDNYVEELKQLVNKYSLQRFVHFEGNQNDVRPYFEIADIFTLTSVSVETFSIAALEAMCFGLPLSLTDIGGASEMIFDGKNGMLSEPKNASSIAATWAALLDAGYNKNDIRKIALDNFSINHVFERYRQAINETNRTNITIQQYEPTKIS